MRWVWGDVGLQFGRALKSQAEKLSHRSEAGKLQPDPAQTDFLHSL